MKIKIYTLITILMVFCILNNETIFAQKNNEKKIITLESEMFDTDRILRFYLLNDGTYLTSEIVVPDELLKAIQKSQNPLLRAKKELYYTYTILELDKRKKEIDNEYNIDFSKNVEFEIDEKFKEQFNHEKQIVQQYAKDKKEEMKKIYGENIPSPIKEKLVDYDAIEKKFPVVEVKEPMGVEKKNYTIYYVLGSLILIIGTVIFWIKVKKKKRKKGGE